MAHTLPELPFARDALAPHISAETLEYHYGKHHNAYVNKLNAALEGGHALAGKSLDDVVRQAEGGLFNNAAQHFNHSFYWNGMRPVGGGDPSGSLVEAINSTFGGLDGFRETFTKTCATHFGSGWGWLVKDRAGALSVVGTHDAGCPLTDGLTPLLTCDVWEHAYYLDFQNRRPDYVAAFLDHLVNWDFAEANLA